MEPEKNGGKLLASKARKARTVIMSASLAVACVAAAGSFAVMTHSKKTGDKVALQGNSTPRASANSLDSQDSPKVVWSYDNAKWLPSSLPPTCPTPLLAVTPADYTKASAVLYPGEMRESYKSYGGFLFNQSLGSSVDVKLAMDATVVRAARYLQADKVRYMLDFVNDCGIALHYDRLSSVSEPFQSLVNTLPEPRANDLSATEITDGPAFKAGDILATAGGTLDFGVYDYRQKNVATNDPIYVSEHAKTSGTDYYAICWLDELPENDKEAIKNLPAGGENALKLTDYCR